MITTDLLQEFDKDDLFVCYHMTVPVKIFCHELDPSKCEIYLSPQMHVAEIIPVLSQYLDWLASCKTEVTEYFHSESGEHLPEDWFENIEIYSAEITFISSEDFGATISFGESVFPDHIVELTIDQFAITDNALTG